MKKVLAMFLIGAMLLNLAACGSTTSGSNETKNETQMEDKNQISSAEAQADDMEKAVSGERPTQGNGKIGFSVHTLGDEFFANLDTAVHQRLEAAGYKVTTISCEGSAAKQVSDIEKQFSFLHGIQVPLLMFAKEDVKRGLRCTDWAVPLRIKTLMIR